jgi:hypothetical protein
MGLRPCRQTQRDRMVMPSSSERRSVSSSCFHVLSVLEDGSVDGDAHGNKPMDFLPETKMISWVMMMW